MTPRRQFLGLVGWLAATFAAAAVGAAASLQAADFYTQLARPGWAPSPAVFGPVWTVLYALMAIAAWLVWRERGFDRARGAVTLFLAQLVVNALWSWLFFAWHQGALALADIALLWVLVLATLVGFWRVSALAGALLLPYLLWISFAAALNFSVWRLNPTLLGRGMGQDWMDLLQWPAMVVTLVAAWLVGSQRKGRRETGFWCFIASNVLWVAWGWQAQAWALIALQVGLFAMNLRGAKKND